MPSPLVSVVVPVYGVEDFVGSCIRSILDQTYANLEIIVVDDGSPDDSIQEVHRAAGGDSRLRVVTQPNSGLGAARNTGVHEARGDYLMVVDSDDLLPDRAVELLVQSLEASGSDFASGRIERFDDHSSWRSGLSKGCFDSYQRGVHFSDVPDAAFDTVAPNKLFRRAFWDAELVAFPEGVAYEDIGLMARAYVRASAIDLIPEVVYLWRDRGGSITSDRLDRVKLRDRGIALIEAVDQARTHGGEVALRAVLRKTVILDLAVYTRLAHRAPSAYVETLRSAFLPIVEQLPADLPLPVDARAAMSALRSGDPEIRRYAAVWAAARRSGLAAWRTGLFAPVLGRLRKPADSVAVALSRTHWVTPAAVRSIIRVGLQSLPRIRRNGFMRRGATVNRLTRFFPRLGVAVWTGTNALGVPQATVRPSSVLVEDVRVDGDSLIVSLVSPDSVWVELRGITLGMSVRLVRRSSSEWSTDVAALLDMGDQSFALALGTPAGDAEGRFTSWKAPTASVAGAAAVEVRSGPKLSVRVKVGVTRVEAEVPVRWVADAGCLRVGHVGPIKAPSPWEGFRLHHRAASLTVAFPRQTGDGSSSGWELPLPGASRHGDRVPLRRGRWILEGLNAGRWLPVSASDPEALDGVVVDDPEGAVSYRLAASHAEVSVRSAMAVNRPESLRAGASRPAWVALTPGVSERAPLERAVVFESYFGKQVSCHPRALLEPLREALPGWTMYWVVNSGFSYAPEGTVALPRWSSEWFEHLSNSALVVTNSALAPQFRRRPGQVVAQTWHGTPLKRIGFDMRSVSTFSSKHLRNLAIEAQQWSYLLSPNPFCSSVFPGAFGYDGPMLEFGSPRNDRLVDCPPPTEVAWIRHRLGISDQSRVVLYAPTWREGELGRNSFALDLGSAARSVGNDVVVLLRGHSNVSGSSTLFDDPNVLNVSDYPDITDLYLASDALITDYSSVMFDFACLQRPMAFHCPDLTDYRDQVRGWYFDFLERAPGPVGLNVEDFPNAIAAVLDNGKEIVASDRYQSFHATFCATERGTASRQVVTTLAADLSHLR